MSGPEELLKTLHKRKVTLQTQDQTEWEHLMKVALQKRGWGRLAELGETYYEHLVSDDNVANLHHSQPSWNYHMSNCVQIFSCKVSIKSLKHDKHFWELFTSKESFRANIIQV